MSNQDIEKMTMQELTDKYMPIRRQSERIYKMPKHIYMNWFLKTPVTERTEIIKEAKGIASAMITNAHRFLKMVGE